MILLYCTCDHQFAEHSSAEYELFYLALQMLVTQIIHIFKNTLTHFTSPEYYPSRWNSSSQRGTQFLTPVKHEYVL